ncbi:MAG TPA: glycosyltransferase family 39 protein [Dehalococcoidia bacterium]
MALTASRTARTDLRVRVRFRQYLQQWQWLGLAAVMLLAGCLNFLRLSDEGYANGYYAAAVKSMLQSWHNFFFVSFDPGGFVTIDKPPLGFWIQTASAKLFGFHGWSLLLPQALAGMLSVGVLFFVVRRVFGNVAGLLAALALAVTPISVATNRNNTIDSLLVLTVLLASWAVLKATERGSLRWLLLSMVLVGLGFNIKTLEAFLVLPALVLVYFLAAPIGWRKRSLHLMAAGVVLIVVSLSWVTTVDLIPASQRPYVGSSQHNSELELALGYNGLQRLQGGGSGAPKADDRASQTTQTQGGDTSGQPPNGAPPTGTGGPGGGGGPGGVGENGPVGVFRLLDVQLGGQIGWLIPAALLGLVAAWQTGVRRRPDRRHQALIVFGIWFFTCAAFFSKALFFHRYYLSMMAPAVAALFGIGAVTLWQAYRRRGPRGWLLPVTLLATAAVQAYILRSYSGWNGWLTPVVVMPCAVAALMLTVARLPLRLRLPAQALAGATALGMLALLVTPAVWAGDTVRNNAAAGGIPSAGPSVRGAGGFGGPGGPPPGMQFARRDDGEQPFAPAFAGGQPPANGAAGDDGAFVPPPDGGAPAGPPASGFGPGGGTNKQLEQYLLANQGSAKYLVAVPSAMAAEQIILDTGKPVMAIGGFTGSDPILTAQSFAALVKQGAVRFVELGGMGGMGDQQSISSWVQSSCTPVPASALQAASGSTAAAGTSNATGGTASGLYDCAGAAS